MKELLLRIYRKTRRTLSINRRIRSSKWYYGVFPHLTEYESIRRNSDILCIGSTPAKFAIDFKATGSVVGSNLATLPETSYYDYQVIRNYHSYLKRNGVILLVLCPFTLLKTKYTSEEPNKNYLNIRYYPVLHRSSIDNYDPMLYDKWVANPYKIGYKAIIRAFLDVSKIDVLSQNENMLSKDEMMVHASQRIEQWKEEFGLNDLDVTDPNFDKLRLAINHNVSIYKQMALFSSERHYKIVVIIPPFSNELTSQIPQEFVKKVLYEPISDLKLKCISYYGIDQWMRKDLYRDSFTLNKRGRQELTKDIVEKLKTENIL